MTPGCSQGAYSASIRSIGARIGGAGPSVVPTMARAAALQSAAALASMSTLKPQALRSDTLPFREMGPRRMPALRGRLMDVPRGANLR